MADRYPAASWDSNAISYPVCLHLRCAGFHSDRVPVGFRLLHPEAPQFWTGILWKSCEDYCEKCKGKATGNCEPVENKECSGGYQCQCSGKDVDKSDNWLVIATCKLGL
ncbi:hypothetical protein Y032_0180g804 [Ancylostoma ceylanicum]|nr:hypothetical protein Y032_0180g804 [Ancylostoma ceylanicum]